MSVERAVQPLDRRTRRDADVGPVAASDFFTREVPAKFRANGRQVVAAIDRLDAPPLAIEVGDETWSVTSHGVTEGSVDGALVITFDERTFSEWAQLKRSFNGLLVFGELRHRDGTLRDVSIWDSLMLTLLEGWPTVDDDLTFLDRTGQPLDLGRAFTPHDDPDDIAHFLREAGFLHLRDWLDPEDMARIAAEIDTSLPAYTEGDGRSWWAELADGTRRCVRLQAFLPHSPTTAAVLAGERWEQLRRTLAADDELVQGRPGDHVVEALVKPPGVVRGISDVNFHRDCHLGGHPYGCSGVDIGFAVTASDESTGRLRVVAGSHRVAIPVDLALTDPYLPIVTVSTEPGDLTVHLSCTLHESTPPVTMERKVMYAPFKLAARPGEDVVGGHDPDARGEIGARLLDAASPSSADTWAERPT